MLPEKFLERMQNMLGEEYPAFLESLSGKRYRALRLNPLKTRIQEGKEKLPFTLSPVPWTKNGFYYEEEEQPGKHPYHEAGLYYIQEPSAMAPVPCLMEERASAAAIPERQEEHVSAAAIPERQEEPATPGRVLDLCAAPGGKSTQIAEYMRGRGMLITNEIHPQRAKILSENIERMGISNAIVLNETPESLSKRFIAFFDRILVDAPCSGEGMFRKNDNAGEEWSEENVALCAERQDGILDCAATMLKPGGRLVYSTCTFAPAEDEGSVSRFLETHPDFCLEKEERLMPHKIKGEGHFLAVLHRKGGQLSSAATAGTEKSLTLKDCREFLDFAKEALTIPAEELTAGKILLRFGEQLYLAPAETPSLRGLKVLRPGLHLGTVKKNRFEPSHALALFLKKEQAVHAVNLACDGTAVRKYLEGQTLTIGEGCDVEMADIMTRGRMAAGQADVSLPKGWCLVCVDGYSLGWGKAAGAILKNHYPKGLRK
ncbi:MAG: RsmF rRNA methyltransferase first C-terminal domain-containing protein [Clostridium sp.]|nr:RsmF rRNA methyltransferase first C-terminal domain-containing protein [Clostridium sp.]